MPDYALAPSLSRASIDDYVRLFGASFAGDGKLSGAYLRWQYADNPHGRVIGTDAFAGDELVAHYAIIPRRYCLGMQGFDAALSVNTATHPSHQGKGLFIRLAEATYQAAAQQGVKFVVGAANANSVGGFTRKLGFTELGQIRLYAGFKAPSADRDALCLQVEPGWLDWRLANPSRRYERVAHGDGSATLRTRVKGVPFNVARLSSDVLASRHASSSLAKGNRLMPGLSPLFSSSAPAAPRLPLKAQPSPWHVIWRALDAGIEAPLAQRLWFDGMAMDTF